MSTGANRLAPAARFQTTWCGSRFLAPFHRSASSVPPLRATAVLPRVPKLLPRAMPRSQFLQERKGRCRNQALGIEARKAFLTFTPKSCCRQATSRDPTARFADDRDGATPDRFRLPGASACEGTRNRNLRPQFRLHQNGFTKDENACRSKPIACRLGGAAYLLGALVVSEVLLFRRAPSVPPQVDARYAEAPPHQLQSLSVAAPSAPSATKREDDHRNREKRLRSSGNR